MLSFEWLIVLGVVLFALGGLVGFLLRTFAFGGSRKEADLAKALAESEEALTDYKREVLERYSDTAEKFRRLNETYADLHQQLAESASVLCGDEITTPLLETQPGQRSNRDAATVAPELGGGETIEASATESADASSGDDQQTLAAEPPAPEPPAPEPPKEGGSSRSASDNPSTA